MDNQVFRKVSLDRLSSPEQLDQIMTVVPGVNWVALVFFFAFLGLVAAWACLGSITSQVVGEGMLLHDSGSKAGNYAILPLNAQEGLQVKESMPAVIYPASSNKTGIQGRVASIARIPGGNGEITGFSIKIALNDEKSGNEAVKSGQRCRVIIVTNKFSPIQLIVRAKAGSS